MTDYAIILAGGKGLRMGSDIPKQFLPIDGMPVLMHTIRRFRAYSDELNIILVLPKEQHDYWAELCRQYHFEERYMVTTGGATRFHSIQNGLKLIPDDAEGVVAVHDGVRPFPSLEVIGRCFEAARTSGAAIPVVPVVETLRQILPTQDPAAPIPATMPSQGSVSRCVTAPPSVTVPRDDDRLVQTPQAFDIQLHKQAYRQPYSDSFTDDASVVEHFGHAITLVEGNRENIKITTPFDIVVASALIQTERTSSFAGQKKCQAYKKEH